MSHYYKRLESDNWAQGRRNWSEGGGWRIFSSVVGKYLLNYVGVQWLVTITNVQLESEATTSSIYDNIRSSHRFLSITIHWKLEQAWCARIKDFFWNVQSNVLVGVSVVRCWNQADPGFTWSRRKQWLVGEWGRVSWSQAEWWSSTGSSLGTPVLLSPWTVLQLTLLWHIYIETRDRITRQSVSSGPTSNTSQLTAVSQSTVINHLQQQSTSLLHPPDILIKMETPQNLDPTGLY